MNKRQIEVLILSDTHLGTRGCEAKPLLNYLRSVEPKLLVLNGDIIDIWQFSAGYFPEAHWAVLREIMDMAEKGIPVYYLTGNHDDTLRKMVPFRMGNIYLENKLMLELDGKLAWIFHGDVYDGSITHGRWIAKIGGRCYDMLIVFNRFVNRILRLVNCRPTHFSKKIKSGVKKAVQKVSNFETKAAEIAIENGYDYVICGHIHRPQMREVKTEKGSVLYLNSGDWLENLTALEYSNGQWEIFQYDEDDFKDAEPVRNLKVNLETLIKSVEDNSIQEVLHKKLIVQKVEL